MKDISLDDMAAQLFISKFYLCYLFKKKTGTTIVNYRNYRKILEAKKLLRDTDLSITAVADTVGFTDHSYFTKLFRQTVGIAPSRFKKLSRGEEP